jgi:predicted dehydrogenase
MKTKERRNFMKQAGIATLSAWVAPVIIPASALGKNGFVPPSDRVNLAFIGAGNQAGNDARGFMRDARVQITAICDVNRRSTGYWDGKEAGREHLMEVVDKHYAEKVGKKYKSCRGFTDFREVMQLKDIDAVVIDTPDHWHAIPVMMAAASKKDIYCQKPMSLTVTEGRDMSNAVKKHQVIFQTGSQQRSNPHFRRVCELVRNGKIGELHTVVCHLPGGIPDFGKTAHLVETAPIPQGFDYEMWLGPAPFAPYAPARTHVNYRWILDYSGGMVTDWGGHHPDIAQWGMDTDHTGPVKIQNARATWADHPHYNTATEFYFECLYANGVKLIVQSEGPNGVTFTGSEGKAWASRGQHTVEPASLSSLTLKPDEIHLYKSDDHYQNFIDCVLSRQQAIAPAEVGHRSVTISHLGNIAMMLRQDLDWDPEQEHFVGNFAANQFLSRQMREPWGSLYRQLKA